MKPHRFIVCLLPVLGLVHASCSASPTGFDKPKESPLLVDAATPNDGPLGCSADLHSVVSENGNVVRACGATEGCANGLCVPGCSAAAAARGSVGCDFRVPTPIVWYGGRNTAEISEQSCFAAMVVNNWPTATRITVERDGISLDVTKFARIPTGAENPALWARLPADGLPPNQVAVLFLSHDPACTQGYCVKCPVTPAVEASTSVYALAKAVSGRGSAFRITTDLPTSSYDIYPFGGAKSFAPAASLLLPTTGWGTNYMASAPSSTLGTTTLQIVGQEDDTNVTVLSNDALPGGENLAGAPALSPTTYRLKAGEFLQFHDAGKVAGSVVASDKPVGVVGGRAMFIVPDTTTDADAAHQMLPPVSSLGNEYVLAPLRRGSSAPTGHQYMVMAAVDGTELRFDPPLPIMHNAQGYVTQPPPALLAARETVEFGHLTTAHRVTSQDAQHPLFVAQYLDGCTDGAPGCGGPEWVLVPPVAQFLTRYSFYTDVTYDSTHLVFTRRKGLNGFRDVKLGCIGLVQGWEDVAATGYQVAVVDVKSRGVYNGSCRDGAQLVESDGPFGLVVWGLSLAASYAYPAGGNLAILNKVNVSVTR